MFVAIGFIAVCIFFLLCFEGLVSRLTDKKETKLEESKKKCDESLNILKEAELRKKAIERDIEIHKSIVELQIQLEKNKRELEKARCQLKDNIRKDVEKELSDLKDILDPDEFKSIVDDEVDYRWNERKKSL